MRILRVVFLIVVAGVGVALIFHAGNTALDTPWAQFWAVFDMILGLVLFISAADHLGWFWGRDRPSSLDSVEGRCRTCGCELFEGRAEEVIEHLSGPAASPVPDIEGSATVAVGPKSSKDRVRTVRDGERNDGDS